MRRIHACILTFFLTVCATAASGELDFGDFGIGPSPSTSALPGLETRERPLLTARLIPESPVIAPGHPLKVVLELNHLSGCYTYWVNPGGPGVGTKLVWDLPEGFAVSEPEWPAPERSVNGPITSYVHKGRTSAVLTLTPPRELKAGQKITLAGTVETQVCTPRSCNPTRLPVSVVLTAGDAPGTQLNPAVAKAMELLPTEPTGWRFEVAQRNGEWWLAMHPAEGCNPSPDGLYFFDAGAPRPLVDSQQPQSVEREDGIIWLRIPRSKEEPAEGERLDGVLYAATGWLEGKPEVTSFEVDLPIASEDAAVLPAKLQESGERRGGVLMIFAFLGGLLLNVMPCVFPVIGLKIMGFAKQAHKDRRAVFLHGLAYTAGVLLCFWTLSFIVVTMGRGWGAQLQSAWFLFALCHVFMIMSMNMAGVFEIGASVSGAGTSLASRDGLKRSFFTGLLATITSTPCSAPFLGSALAYALSLPALMALGMFTLMGLGFSFPYLALSLVPGWLKKLPKPGPWMDTFRQAMCFPLFATTAYLFWAMEAMVPEFQFLLLLFGLVLTAMACWLYGKSQKSQVYAPRASRFVFAIAIVALAAGLWLGLPKGKSKLEWAEWSPEIVERLREEGRPVFVEFTARWCATCQLNKHVFLDENVVDLILNKNVVLLKADWTRYDDRITKTLKNEFNKAAVPVTVLYRPGESEANVLPDILTAGNVSDHLSTLP